MVDQSHMCRKFKGVTSYKNNTHAKYVKYVTQNIHRTVILLSKSDRRSKSVFSFFSF